MIPFMEACVDPAFKQIIFVCGSQMAKTDSVLNVMGERLDDDPSPLLYVGPTKSNVEKVIEPRFMKMVRSADSLHKKLAKKKRSKTHKEIAGVSVRFAWAGSATELASQDAAIVLVDEYDRMVGLKNEGDPFDLADARTSTYPDGKTIGTSTPTEGNVDEEYDPKTGLTRWKYEDPENIGSATWRRWQEGTRFEWAWPCPSCKEYFIPRFSLLVWPSDAKLSVISREARLECPHCKYKISEKNKTEMNARGRYVAPGQSIRRDGTVVGEVEPNECASFWVSGLCSPWKSFGARARAFVAASRSGDPERIQVAVNTGFGELWKVAGEAKPWEEVRNHVADYFPDTIPTGVQLITTFVDVQKDRLVYAHRGWGYNQESWGLGWGEIWGETEYEPVWTKLSELLNRGVGGKPITLMGVDSGFRPGEKHRTPENMVYAFARRNRDRVIATKGHDTQDKPVKKTLIDVTVGGKLYKLGLPLWHLNADYFKGWVYGRLEWPVGESGAFHLPTLGENEKMSGIAGPLADPLHPRGTSDEYCQQLVSEARILKPSGHFQWVRIRKQNHTLDCEAGNAALAHILQVPLMQQSRPDRVQSAPTSVPAAQRDGSRQVRRSKYMRR